MLLKYAVGRGHSATRQLPAKVNIQRPGGFQRVNKWHNQIRIIATVHDLHCDLRTCLSPSKPGRSSLSPPKMDHMQTRTHAGHSHGHTQGENAYLTSTNKNDAGVRITRIGLFVNLAMAVGKGVGGYVFHSQALIADAFHALTDLVSDFMTLATISWSLKPPTSRFPIGYGKIESLGALGVSGLLLFGGIGMGANAIDALYIQFVVESSHEAHSHGLFSFLGHSHSHGPSIPDLKAIWLAGGSIVVKEWLYRASRYQTPFCIRWLAEYPLSYENRQGAKVGCLSIQCCAPPD